MGTYKNSAFSKASIYDPATGDVAQMNTLVAPETKFYEPEIIEQPITNGAYQSSWRFKVDFASSDWDAYDQLRTFKDAYTEVRAVAAGAGKNSKNLQWYESVQIAELRRVPKGNRSEGDSFFIVSLVFEGGENTAIFNNVNLLYTRNVLGVNYSGFSDAISGLYAGFINNPSTIETKSVSNGVLTAINDAGSAIADIIFDLFFPIVGIQLDLSTEYTQVNAGSPNLGLKSLTYGETVVDSDNTVTAIAARISSSIILSSNSYEIRCELVNTDAHFNIKLQEPCLRTDGESTYIAG